MDALVLTYAGVAVRVQELLRARHPDPADLLCSRPSDPLAEASDRFVQVSGRLCRLVHGPASSGDGAAPGQWYTALIADTRRRC